MSRRILVYAELLVIIILACVPLFVILPYRVNIFLSWEGAYRMSKGQLPFRDFGIPLGGAYWVIPAIFFKLFGPKLITLVKAQVFINIIAALSFRSILTSVSIRPPLRFLAVLTFCISYSFFNFWPWYNHSVIVFELVALAFLFKYLCPTTGKNQFFWLPVSAFFVCFAFLTKQDGGGMALMICLALLGYYCISEKKWIPLLSFAASCIIIFLLLIAPFLQYGFGYWFNHGQPPHTARISAMDIAEEFFGASQWIKFYLLIIVILLPICFKDFKTLYRVKAEALFLLLTLGMLAEAAIFQVTSYTPPDNNIFFHSFAFAYLLHLLKRIWPPLELARPHIIIICAAGILLWWSGTYWKYIQRIAGGVFQSNETTKSVTGENIVNRKTYMIDTDSAEIPMGKWVQVKLKSFDRISVPKPTADGIDRLLNMSLVKQSKNINVLNMTELTPLAEETPYSLERNPQLPLWFHLGVGMFNRQAELYEKRIRDHYYDLVLFEYVPRLNNFYPFRIRDSLKLYYRLTDTFTAPRRGDTQGTIEVYIKP